MPEEALSFIEEVIKKYKPDFKDPDQFMTNCLKSGLMNQVLQACISVVEKNPSIFKLQVTKIISSKGEIIKTEIRDEL